MTTCREQILSEEYRDFISTRVGAENSQGFFENACIQNVGELYRIEYVEKEVADPISLSRYPYDAIPKCFALLDVESMQQSGILAVQNYPNLELRGEGVLVGFVDTGIDYRNQVFRNLDGSTRIVSIWDQSVQTGTPPTGFSYGTEYRQEVIDLALQRENPYELVESRDVVGHGTFLASVATGGAVVEEEFIGAAPEAMIAMVKLKPAKKYIKDFYFIPESATCYQETDIMLGMAYLNQLAEELELPLVLCVALGTNQGSHSGSSPLAGLLDIYSNVGNRAVVVGAGNEANARHHYYGEANLSKEIRQVEVRVGDRTTGFSTELWADALDLYAISIVSPSGESTYRFPIRSGITQTYTFIFEQTMITVDYKVFVERLNAELIFLRFQNPTSGIWRIQVEPIQLSVGNFHMWLPMNEFLETEIFFLESNPDVTITEPGNIAGGMAVGFYHGADNSVAIQSGRGYTRSERIKPDFVAPGVDVIGATYDNRFVVRTGSSIAVGIAAGATALLMEWVVYRLKRENVDSTQIKNLLILGTTKRENESYPNREWGYGTLNVYQTFEVIRRI